MGRIIAKYVCISVLVVIGALLFAEIAGDCFNGMPWGDAAVLGGIIYLCIVIVVCTGVIPHRIDKRNKNT